MNFFQRLLSLFTGGGRSSGGRWMSIYVISRRCNEPLSAQVDLLNALSGSDDSDAAFYTRKVLQGTGANRCFAQVEVELWFDSQRKLLRHHVEGGRWLTEDEYAAEVERINAPPETETDERETNSGQAPEHGDDNA